MAEAGSIEGQMRDAMPELTRAERQLAQHILSHYPMSALGSITTLARAAEVSSPTVVRLVQKLGFRGYPDYQAALRAEVQDLLRQPLQSGRRPAEPRGDHLLDRFAEAAAANLHATFERLAPEVFDRVIADLADLDRRVWVMGGRLSHAHADYFAALLKVVRPDVTLLSDMTNPWQPALLDLRPGDVAVLFDIRRYESTVVVFAELAAAQGANVVLLTDSGPSPAAAFARHVLPCQIAVPSAWDSTVPILALVEALVAGVQSLLPRDTGERLKRLEDYFARTRFFRPRD